jgi:DNA helicase-2/ATP-dependent DNA helicase PcrA
MDDSNYVTLATVHAVKGLEFKCVFICGLEENILPVSRAVDNDDDMEEERRLMYVAITRAKDRLYLTRSKSRYLYGKREPTARSRFLKELSSELELPKEVKPMPRGYDSWDDPDSYGNSAYGGGRYASNDDYGGRRTSFGGGYGSAYSKSYGDSSRQNSGVTRSVWKGNNYGGTSPQSKGGFVYGGIGKATPAAKPAGGKNTDALSTGVKVKHPKFGEGIIVASRGVGSNKIVDIAFEAFGIKQLSATLAPLTIIG